MDNFDLKKYLVENKATTNSRMMKEESTKKKPVKVSKVKFPNGKTFQKGGEDEEGNIVIFIHKYAKGYGVSGQEYDWDNDEHGDEAYTYYYDLEGNESSENDIVTTDYAFEDKVTRNSRIMNEIDMDDMEATPEAISTYVQLMKSKFGANLGKFIEDKLYDEANMNYDLPEVWSDEEFAKFAEQDLELLADIDGADVIDANFAKQVVAQALEAIDGVEKYYA